MLKVLHLQVHTQEGENINVTNLMSVFEIIGSIAFAISGSMLAIKKEMDLFGILILGIVTSVGGGAIRDIVIGNTPPAMFQNPKKSPAVPILCTTTCCFCLTPSDLQHLQSSVWKQPSVF